MGWTGLARIDDVEPVGDADRAVMDEVRAVLERHGALDRFGLTLLHSHFDLNDDEILVETVDRERRTLTTRPMPVAEAAGEGSLVETSWRLDAEDGVPRAVVYCFRTKSGIHMLDHPGGEGEGLP